MPSVLEPFDWVPTRESIYPRCSTSTSNACCSVESEDVVTKMGKFKLGDRVIIKANPYDLPDPAGIGRLNISTEELSKVYLIKSIGGNDDRCKLTTLEGRNFSGWFYKDWLELANPIWLHQKEKKCVVE